MVVHPLFTHLKSVVPLVDQVPEAKLAEISPKRFYQEFLSNSLPLVVTDGA
jgi:hypothetical protein